MSWFYYYCHDILKLLLLVCTKFICLIGVYFLACVLVFMFFVLCLCVLLAEFMRNKLPWQSGYSYRLTMGICSSPAVDVGLRLIYVSLGNELNAMNCVGQLSHIHGVKWLQWTEHESMPPCCAGTQSKQTKQQYAKIIRRPCISNFTRFSSVKNTRVLFLPTKKPGVEEFKLLLLVLLSHEF